MREREREGGREMGESERERERALTHPIRFSRCKRNLPLTRYARRLKKSRLLEEESGKYFTANFNEFRSAELAR